MNAPETARRSTPGKLEARAAELRSMYFDRGMTQDEIAVALDCTPVAVRRFMRRHGLKARRQIKRDQRGARNSSWAGECISYKGAHARVARIRGRPKHCIDCGSSDESKRYEWANVSGRYHDPADYVRLCRSCHCKRDRLIRNLGDHAKAHR